MLYLDAAGCRVHAVGGEEEILRGNGGFESESRSLICIPLKGEKKKVDRDVNYLKEARVGRRRRTSLARVVTDMAPLGPSCPQ